MDGLNVDQNAPQNVEWPCSVSANSGTSYERSMSEHFQSPFVIFDHGTPIYPPNDLHQRTAEIIGGLSGLSPQAAVQELLKPRPLVPFSWHPAIAHMLRYYFEPYNNGHGMEERLLSLIPLMIKQPIEVAWQALRDELISHVDAFSGWSYSLQKVKIAK
jgi:hypothetical protein